VRLGIDFGTTHTVAALTRPDGRIQPLLFASSPLLSSAVFAEPDGRLLTGQDAERGARLDPSRYEPNVKRRIDEGTRPVGRVPAGVCSPTRRSGLAWVPSR
jgi:molecular chaperone DnaK (HSP70)